MQDLPAKIGDFHQRRIEFHKQDHVFSQGKDGFHQHTRLFLNTYSIWYPVYLYTAYIYIYTHTYTRVHTDITLHAYTCITTMFNFFGHQAPVTPWYRLHLGRFLRPFRMAIWDKHNWICSILPVFLPRNGSRCLGATSFASWVRVLGAGNWRKSMELPYKSLINQYSPLWCWFSGDVRFSCDMSCWF